MSGSNRSNSMHKFALSVAVVGRVSDTHHGPGDADHGLSSYHAIAFVNVGLASSALRGISREFDSARISDMVAATMVSADVLGIGFCGVGDAFEGLLHTAAEAFHRAVVCGFERAGAAEHGSQPQVFVAANSSMVTALL